MPSLGQTLVSVNKLNKGFNLSESGVPSLSLGGEKWADVMKTSSGLLVLSVVYLLPTTSKPLVALTTSTSMLWHIRLGHPGLHAMSDMSRSGDIPRLTVEEVEQVKNCQFVARAR